jgi:hypothetical protein
VAIGDGRCYHYFHFIVNDADPAHFHVLYCVYERRYLPPV